jgi:uncharacterized protein with GYD domain
MPTYINLLRFTQKGVETIREGPKYRKIVASIA